MTGKQGERLARTKDKNSVLGYIALQPLWEELIDQQTVKNKSLDLIGKLLGENVGAEDYNSGVINT